LAFDDPEVLVAALSGVTTPYNTYWVRRRIHSRWPMREWAVATKMADDSSPDQGDHMRNTKCWLTYLLPAIALAGRRALWGASRHHRETQK